MSLVINDLIQSYHSPQKSLFVFSGTLNDYTKGVAICVADTFEEAVEHLVKIESENESRYSDINMYKSPSIGAEIRLKIDELINSYIASITCHTELFFHVECYKLTNLLDDRPRFKHALEEMCYEHLVHADRYWLDHVQNEEDENGDTQPLTIVTKWIELPDDLISQVHTEVNQWQSCYVSHASAINTYYGGSGGYIGCFGDNLYESQHLQIKITPDTVFGCIHGGGGP